MKNLHWWLLLLCVPLYGFWTVPYLTESRPALIKAERIEKDKKTRSAEQLTALKEQEADIKKNNNQALSFSTRIPPVLAQEYLIEDLRKITLENGFSAESFSFSQGQNGDTGAAQITADFSAEGRRDRLAGLLQMIENNPRFLGLETLNYSVTNYVDGALTISLKLYTLGQKF